MSATGFLCRFCSKRARVADEARGACLQRRATIVLFSWTTSWAKMATSRSLTTKVSPSVSRGSLPRGEADSAPFQDGPLPVCASPTVPTKPRCSTVYKLPLRNRTAASAATRARRCRSGGTLRDTSGSRRSIACRKWDGRSRTGTNLKSRWAANIRSRGEGAVLGSLSVGGKGS